MGLEVMPEETVEAEQVRLAMVPVGQGRIELLEPLSESSAIAKFLAKRGEASITSPCTSRTCPRWWNG